MTEQHAPSALATSPRLLRRAVLKGTVIAGAGAPFLAACGASDDGSAAGDLRAPAGDGGSSSTGGGSAAVLTTIGEVPTGGGVVLDDAGIVITQPQAGDFKGFTNICTHMGCPVGNVSGGTINCPCHGSQYSIEDGSVVTGPATSPLAEKPIVVHGKDILAG
jgi:Rieske Fe-S protein